VRILVSAMPLLVLPPAVGRFAFRRFPIPEDFDSPSKEHHWRTPRGAFRQAFASRCAEDGENCFPSRVWIFHALKSILDVWLTSLLTFLSEEFFLRGAK
jgi:hypothetical protein